MTVPPFGYTTGNPDNLIGGQPASMTDVQGPFYDLRSFLNETLKPLLDAMGLATFGPGDIKPTAAAAVSAGWLLCDGKQDVIRSQYPDLFTAIGTAYGAGDGTTTFGLPDLRGRVPVGVNGTAIPGPPAISVRARGNPAGVAGGEEAHKLTVPELAPHDHTPLSASDSFSIQKTGATLGVPSGSTWQMPNYTNTATGTTGGNQSHNNMPPFVVINWLIKT